MDNKKLKIAFLSRYYGKVDRGVETYVTELSKRLSKNHQVEILKDSDSDNLGKIIAGGYDFVIPTNGRLQALKTSFGKLFSHYKVIISGQAGIGKDDIWNIFITSPNIYVALTDWEKRWAKKWAFLTKVVKIPNGVDLQKFSPDGGKVEINLPHPIILSVGALHWYKHHERVIKAVSKLKNGSLLIIGQGSEELSLQKLGEKLLGLGKLCIIQVGYNDLPKYYRSVDLFTLPSWDRESFGIVYVEAMASGLPVVAPDDPPRREIVGDAGILVNVENSEKYAQALEKVLSKNWGNIPRKQAEKFSWDKITVEYEKLFKELV